MMRRSNRARYKSATLVNKKIRKTENHYKLESKAAMRATASRESLSYKGFFEVLSIRIKPA
jgi:hypothetical protein